MEEFKLEEQEKVYQQEMLSPTLCEAYVRSALQTSWSDAMYIKKMTVSHDSVIVDIYDNGVDVQLKAHPVRRDFKFTDKDGFWTPERYTFFHDALDEMIELIFFGDGGKYIKNSNGEVQLRSDVIIMVDGVEMEQGELE